jgi:hypothetical protein
MLGGGGNGSWLALITAAAFRLSRGGEGILNVIIK